MNLILMRNGYPISSIRTENRDDYMKSLEITSTEGDLNDFITIVKNAVDKSLELYLYILN